MKDSRHHGRHSFAGKNELRDRRYYQEEVIGRFGRMFNVLPPLYNRPKDLSTLGNAGGPMDAGGSASFTNNVPLGMIFLGQFIDHDITFDITSSFNNINEPTAIDNERTPTLDLDCVFGDGPEGSPHLYKEHADGFYLLTGKTNNNLGQGKKTEEHDLPRNGIGTALIGDPRNDENRVISQLQLAFIRFYNSIYHDLESSGKYTDPGEIHEKAREEATWHYQWCVVNEFLPAICGKYIVDDILGNGRQFYQPEYQVFIPVEFSVAAYRFGHSMIAQNMKMQPGGATHNIFSTQFGQGFKPIKNTDQMAGWECFFDFDGTYQRAEKLDTKIASDLLNLPFIPSPDPSDKSLATRNLRRGQSFLLPSGENVAEYMEIGQNHIDDVKNRISNNLSGTGIDLSSGTPLWYYILAEAEEIGIMNPDGTTSPGEGLGPVGARIVAEVLIGLLELDDRSYLGSNRDWSPHLGATANEYSMKELLERSLTAVDL